MKLDPTIFTSMGIDLPADDQFTFEAYFMETLEERIGIAISELLDDKQLNELLDLQEAGDTGTVDAFLHANVPDFKDVIRDEFDILMGEVSQHADKISV